MRELKKKTRNPPYFFRVRTRNDRYNVRFSKEISSSSRIELNWMSTGLVFSVLIRRSDDVDDDENFSTPLHFFSDPETLNIDRSNKSKENSKIFFFFSHIFTHNNNNNNNNRDTTKMSKDLVLLYCTQQNRPFNATNLADALQKEGVKKATAQRYLDNLV